MEAHLFQWLNLTLRWIHVITGIAWIGTSFYFNWLNSRIAAPLRPEPGVTGELWSVHGGGFYRMVKYTVAPERLPPTLHWFKWEAYATWISGVALLVLIYYLQAGVYLTDPQVAHLSSGVAAGIGLGALAGAWLVYDLLCRSDLAKHSAAFATVGMLLMAGATWGLSRLFSARAAYIHVGAMLGTIMAANVFRVIIPSQREMVTAMQQGREPDPAQGIQAALRSLHNNYLTLPVLFIMVSNHYPATYGNQWNWVILTVLAVIGAATRHYFNLRNQGRQNVWILPAAALGMVVLAVVSRPEAVAPRPAAAAPGGSSVSFVDVRVVMVRRCAPCHSATPTNQATLQAPQGVLLDTPEQIRAQAERIYAVAVAGQTMPLGNLTGMTGEERDLLGRWVREGARVR